MTRSLTKAFSIALMGVGVIIIIMDWADKRDVQVFKNAEIYEKCFDRVYGMTPANYYILHDYYPECK